MPSLAPRPLQRIGPLARLPLVLASYGVSTSEVLADLPLTEADLRPETLLPIPLISAVLDRASALAGGAPVGLLLARGQDHQVLGPLGQLMASCETLGSAIGSFVSLQMVNSTAAAGWLLPMGEDYAWGFGVYARELASSHLYDASALIGCNILQGLTAGAIAPAEVLLSRPQPADPAPYQQIFRCPVRFNEAHTAVILPKRAMGHRLASANAEVRGALHQAMQKMMAEQHPGFAGRVRHVLRPMLLAGRASHREVAAHLAIHPRTLGRRLEEEGFTFEDLKDEVRAAVSHELLARTSLSIADVGAALGYGTPSAFVRAFRRWTGQSPSAWRRGLRNAATGVAKWQPLRAETELDLVDGSTGEAAT